ncbi:phage integrase central domain-containing protein [Allosphingosinicella humi]
MSEENSFKLVAEEWVAKNERERMAEVTPSKVRWLLAKAYPKLGDHPIAKIPKENSGDAFPG